ncbi:MAG: hypothetical protein ACOYXT_10265, partial [Bacteroidota bacterium]
MSDWGKKIAADKTSLTLRVHQDYSIEEKKSFQQEFIRHLSRDEVADVWITTIGDEYWEVTIDLLYSSRAEKNIKSILESIGLLEDCQFVYHNHERELSWWGEWAVYINSKIRSYGVA